MEKSTKVFYVADGYCNSRVIKFNVTVDAATGEHKVAKVTQWGEANGAGLSISK